MSLVPDSAERVPRSTPSAVNRQIREETRRSLHRAAADRAALTQRLEDLEAEWDVERALEATAASFGLAGAALSLVHDRRWAAFPLVVAGFLLQHAIQGWCPPLAVFRRLGVRTRREIEDERHALKLLRGDYASFGGTLGPDAALARVERR